VFSLIIDNRLLVIISGGGFVSDKFSNTQKISFKGKEYRLDANEVLQEVRRALEEKGYDPVVQIVGYLLSGDPTYITGHNNARNMIARIERDELMETVVDFYLKGKVR